LLPNVKDLDAKHANCKCLIEGESFTFENDSKIYINEKMNCMSKNVIYVLNCAKCGKNYVGETSDHLSMRMNVHRQQIKDTNLRHLYVSKHIANCCTNVESNFTVMPIRKVKKDDPDIRRFLENEIIKKHHPSLNRT
jgi:tripartite motif-containing protein 2/3